MDEKELMAGIFNKRGDISWYPFIFRESEETGEGGETISKGDITYQVVAISLAEAIQETLVCLNEREVKIMKLLLEGKTPKEVAVESAVKRTRFGQILKRIMRKLRKPENSHLLREFLIPIPEDRFLEKKRIIDLKEKLRKAEEPERLAREANEAALKTALEKAGVIYRERGNKIILSRVRNALSRNGITRLSQLEELLSQEQEDREGLRSLREIGAKSLEFIKETLRQAE